MGMTWSGGHIAFPLDVTTHTHIEIQSFGVYYWCGASIYWLVSTLDLMLWRDNRNLCVCGCVCDLQFRWIISALLIISMKKWMLDSVSDFMKIKTLNLWTTHTCIHWVCKERCLKLNGNNIVWIEKCVCTNK